MSRKAVGACQNSYMSCTMFMLCHNVIKSLLGTVLVFLAPFALFFKVCLCPTHESESKSKCNLH